MSREGSRSCRSAAGGDRRATFGTAVRRSSHVVAAHDTTPAPCLLHSPSEPQGEGDQEHGWDDPHRDDDSYLAACPERPGMAEVFSPEAQPVVVRVSWLGGEESVVR